MKFAIITLLLAAAFLLGCADTTVSPVEPTNTYQLIKIPAKSGLSIEALYFKSKLFDGALGGNIVLNESYQSINGTLVIIDAQLEIPANAFQGSITISMTIDNDYAAIEFQPGMNFDKELKLDLSFSGLDLRDLGLNSGNLDFVFIDDNGNIETISKNGIHFNEKQGLLSVQNAKLSHFSRYAFTR